MQRCFVSAPSTEAALRAQSSRWSEPEKRGLAMSIAVVEMPATRSGPGARLTSRSSGCGGGGFFVGRPAFAGAARTRAVSPLPRMAGDGAPLEAGLPLAGRAVEFPLRPRTGDVVAVEPALAERTAHVVAGVRQRAERLVAQQIGRA